MSTNKFHALATVLSVLTVVTQSSADLGRGDDDPPEITDIYTDLDAWLEEVPTVQVIEFNEFPNGTQIDDEYSYLGVEFTNGFYTINDSSGFLDDWGLDGNQSTITMHFDQSFNFIGALFPGTLRYELYSDGELVGWTQDQGGGGAGFFAGLITETAFDEVRVVRIGEVQIDNLYFSFDPVPSPGALALLGIAALAGRRTQRI